MRLTSVALLSIVATAAAQTAQITPAEQSSSHVVQRGSDSLPASVRLLNNGKSDSEAAREVERLSSAERRENVGLVLTLVLVVATLLQFLALRWQGRLLKQSVDELKDPEGPTRKSAAAASQSASAAAVHAQAAQQAAKAAVAAQCAHILFDAKGTVDRMGPTAGRFYDILFKNFGKTPAVLGLVDLRFEYLRARPTDLPDNPLAFSLVGRVVSGDNDFFLAPVQVNATADQLTAQADGSGVYLSGRIRYTDVFGAERETAICWLYDKDRFRRVEDPTLNHQT